MLLLAQPTLGRAVYCPKPHGKTPNLLRNLKLVARRGRLENADPLVPLYAEETLSSEPEVVPGHVLCDQVLKGRVHYRTHVVADEGTGSFSDVRFQLHAQVILEGWEILLLEGHLNAHHR